jgi:hypothetical protein
MLIAMRLQARSAELYEDRSRIAGQGVDNEAVRWEAPFFYIYISFLRRN